MTQAHKTPGAIVEFVDKMYRPPYAPYYDAYKGELFEVKDPNKHPGHMLVQNVKGGTPFLIHDDEVKTITKERQRELAPVQRHGVRGTFDQDKRNQISHGG